MTKIPTAGPEPVAHDFSLLADQPLPAGVIASPWRADEHGRLCRTLSDGRIQLGNGDIECTSCTVPTDRADGLCAFCADPPPPLDGPGYGCSTGVPTTLLDSAANHAVMAGQDVSDQLAALPADSSMWVSVDLVRAQRHLRAAIRLIEQTAQKIDAEAVAR